MKQRAGLGKKVSSIFDGVPLPNVIQESEQASKSAETHLPPVHKQSETEIAPRQVPSAPQMPARPAPSAAPQPRPAAIPKPQTTFTDRPVMKVNAIAAAKESVLVDAWQKLIHKYFFTGDKELDARNRRAIMMAGVLLVALVAVLWWTGFFSGYGANRSTGNIASAANNDVYINWSKPQLLPADLTDPMVLHSTKNSNKSSSFGGALVVKAIVLSDHSTAVINGQILHEGQKVEGTDITVIKIYKDKVEFSQNGKPSWTQQVE